MAAAVLAKDVRKYTLMRNRWKCDTAGMDGLGRWVHRARGLAFIHSIAEELDGELWEHISVSRRDGAMPDWAVTRNVFREVAGQEAIGVIVIPPLSKHVNIAEVAHVWHCLTKDPVPDFTHGGVSI
jgi:hypothetical protein